MVVFKSILLCLITGVLGRMLKYIDVEGNDSNSADWDSADGEKVAAFDPKYGVDSDGHGKRVRFAISAVWEEDEKPDEVVVTDIVLEANSQYCEDGYARVAYWIPDESGGKSFKNGWSPETSYKGNYMALCEKREKCAEGKSFVSKFVAKTDSMKGWSGLGEKFDGADIIGYWDSERCFVNGRGINCRGYSHYSNWSARTGESSSWFMGLYQAKKPCPFVAKCAELKIVDIKLESPETAEVTNVQDMSLIQEHNHCCLHCGPLTYEAKLTQGISQTIENTLYFERELTNYWEREVTHDFQIGASAEAGVSEAATVGANVGYQYTNKKTDGEIKRKFESNKEFSSTTTYGGFETKCSYDIPPGRVGVFRQTLFATLLRANFKADIACLDKNGVVLETQERVGKYEANMHVGKGGCTTSSRLCNPTQMPTMDPTDPPTGTPTLDPTAPATDSPTEAPTEAPTLPPTEAPTLPPTDAPTLPPTEAPTFSCPTEEPQNGAECDLAIVGPDACTYGTTVCCGEPKAASFYICSAAGEVSRFVGGPVPCDCQSPTPAPVAPTPAPVAPTPAPEPSFFLDDDHKQCCLDGWSQGQGCRQGCNMCNCADGSHLCGCIYKTDILESEYREYLRTQEGGIRCPATFPACWTDDGGCVLESCAEDNGEEECDWTENENYIWLKDDEGNKVECTLDYVKAPAPQPSRRPCGDFTKAGQCANQGVGCSWSKRLRKCLKKAAPAPASCSDIMGKAPCNKQAACKWNQKKRSCLKDAAKQPTDKIACSEIIGSKKCNKQAGCEWQKGKCIDPSIVDCTRGDGRNKKVCESQGPKGSCRWRNKTRKCLAVPGK